MLFFFAEGVSVMAESGRRSFSLRVPFPPPSSKLFPTVNQDAVPVDVTLPLVPPILQDP